MLNYIQVDCLLLKIETIILNKIDIQKYTITFARLTEGGLTNVPSLHNPAILYTILNTHGSSPVVFCRLHLSL